MEIPITINSKDARLEGLLNKNCDKKAAVVCHPHPLYGGSMDNPVVKTIADAFYEKGYTTLRFNFRGVGNSTGEFDDGIGEQDDLLAAVAMLAEDGFKEITLTGYSFGTWINAQVVSNGYAAADHIMVSPPVGFMSFDDIDVMCSTGLIICGEYDEYAPVALIEDHIKKWKISPRLEIIKNGDHFYSTGLGRLREILTAYLA